MDKNNTGQVGWGELPKVWQRYGGRVPRAESFIGGVKWMQEPESENPGKRGKRPRDKALDPDTQARCLEKLEGVLKMNGNDVTSG